MGRNGVRSKGPLGIRGPGRFCTTSDFPCSTSIEDFLKIKAPAMIRTDDGRLAVHTYRGGSHRLRRRRLRQRRTGPRDGVSGANRLAGPGQALNSSTARRYRHRTVPLIHSGGSPLIRRRFGSKYFSLPIHPSLPYMFCNASHFRSSPRLFSRGVASVITKGSFVKACPG